MPVSTIVAYQDPVEMSMPEYGGMEPVRVFAIPYGLQTGQIKGCYFSS